MRSKRFEYLDQRPVNQDGYAKEWPEVGFIAMNSPFDPTPSIKIVNGEVVEMDGKTKDELIAKDPKCAEIIKPLLKGNDVRKYSITYNDRYIINSHNGYKNVSRVDIEKDYPSIKEWLDKFKNQLEKRYDKGETPYNLRNCAYVDEFEKEKRNDFKNSKITGLIFKITDKNSEEKIKLTNNLISSVSSKTTDYKRLYDLIYSGLDSYLPSEIENFLQKSLEYITM